MTASERLSALPEAKVPLMVRPFSSKEYSPEAASSKATTSSSGMLSPAV